MSSNLPGIDSIRESGTYRIFGITETSRELLPVLPTPEEMDTLQSLI
jgi:hypothetical protein